MCVARHSSAATRARPVACRGPLNQRKRFRRERRHQCDRRSCTPGRASRRPKMAPARRCVVRSIETCLRVGSACVVSGTTAVNRANAAGVNGPCATVTDASAVTASGDADADEDVEATVQSLGAAPHEDREQPDARGPRWAAGSTVGSKHASARLTTGVPKGRFRFPPAATVLGRGAARPAGSSPRVGRGVSRRPRHGGANDLTAADA